MGPVALPEVALNTGRQRALEGFAQGVTQTHLLAQCGEQRAGAEGGLSSCWAGPGLTLGCL